MTKRIKMRRFMQTLFDDENTADKATEIERPKPERQTKKIYFARMKIDETFRDLKSLLGMTKLMNKHQGKMEKMLVLLLLVFALQEERQEVEAVFRLVHLAQTEVVGFSL